VSGLKQLSLERLSYELRAIEHLTCVLAHLMFSRLLLLLSLTSLSLYAQPIGDGKADDTAAVQTMVDAGGAVRFPHGTYRLTKWRVS
jgi:hypothetical protein